MLLSVARSAGQVIKGQFAAMSGLQEAILEANQERDSNVQQHEAQQAEQQQSLEALQAQACMLRLAADHNLACHCQL